MDRSIVVDQWIALAEWRVNIRIVSSITNEIPPGALRYRVINPVNVIGLPRLRAAGESISP